MSLPSIASSLTSLPVLQGLATQSANATQGRPVTGSASDDQPPSTAELQQAVAQVQRVIQPVAQDLLFTIDKDSGKTIVRIVDSATDEVIRQIPSEELIAIAKALNKLQGLLLKQQA